MLKYSKIIMWAYSWEKDSKNGAAVTSLTTNTPLIQLWCAQSKLNKDEICCSNIHLWYVECRYTTKSLIEITPCAKKVIFITEFAIWCKNSPFYEVNKIFQKRLCAWRNFKIIFSRPLFIIIFRMKILSSGPYSILRVKMMYDSVK